MSELLSLAKTGWERFSKDYFVYHSQDEIQARRGYLLSVIFVVGLILSVVTFIASGRWLYLAFAMPAILCYILTRLGFFQWVSFLIVCVTFLASFDDPFDFGSLYGFGYVNFVLCIVLTGVLIGPRWMFITASITSLCVWYAQYLQAYVSGGDFLIAILVIYFLIAGVIFLALQEEKGVLANFKSVKLALTEFSTNFEQQMTKQTDVLEKYLNLTKEISGIITTNQTNEGLFRQTVELIQTKFQFYHIHIYQYEADLNRLKMVYGAGEVGRQLKQQGHIISIGQGIVGLTAQTKQPICVDDVDTFSDFVSNPLLPRTKSEMALPLIVDEKVFGVLDIQSDVPAAFTLNDRDLMQALANQIAVALANIEAIEETKRALTQVEALNFRLTQDSWHRLLEQRAMTGYVYTPQGVKPIKREWLSSMGDAWQSINRATTETNLTGPDITIPIKLRGHVIGILGLERETHDPWLEDDKVIIQAAAEQIGLALEGARLFENTQRNAWRDQVVGEMTAQMWSSREIEEVLKSAVEKLGEQLGATDVVVRLNVEDEPQG